MMTVTRVMAMKGKNGPSILRTRIANKANRPKKKIYPCALVGQPSITFLGYLLGRFEQPLDPAVVTAR